MLSYIYYVIKEKFFMDKKKSEITSSSDTVRKPGPPMSEWEELTDKAMIKALRKAREMKDSKETEKKKNETE